MSSLGASAISILHSLGVLALMSIGISMLQPSRLDIAAGWLRSLLMGLVFGATVSIVMVDPVTLPPGATFDARGAPALLAGIYGGPIAAIVTAIIGSLTRIAIGGAGATGGVYGLVACAALGVAAGAYLKRRGMRPGIAWLFGYALLGTLAVMPSFLFFADLQTGLSVLSHAWWMLLSCNVVGVLALGFLLEQDWRRRQLELDLRETEARTRVAADSKIRFLASMSHEIRTPMNAVVGFVDLLRDSRLDSFQRRCTDQIRDAARGLLRIIDDILDYAKIDAGRVTLEPQPTDVVALISGCREMLLPQIDRKGITCSVDFGDQPPAVLDVDPVRVRQIVLNLLGNAVKFTDSGNIAVVVRYQPGAAPSRGDLTIAITDTGIGMTTEERGLLFNPFVQGNHTGRGGTGLGLVICHMLVQAMGGELTLDSALGQGTTVTVRLPLRMARDAAEPASQSRPPVDAPEVAALRILVAEDVALNAEMLQHTLQRAGHTVRVVADGERAVEAVGEAPFDLILMDVQMPVMDGLEATRAIRALSNSQAAIPIVALTAYASQDDLRACLDAGMNDYLTKPLDRSKLQAALARWGGAVHPGSVMTASG
jgi:signal transduction histidine kinase/ActR/RegA family two-component response regulator